MYVWFGRECLVWLLGCLVLGEFGLVRGMWYYCGILSKEGSLIKEGFGLIGRRYVLVREFWLKKGLVIERLGLVRGCLVWLKGCLIIGILGLEGEGLD